MIIIVITELGIKNKKTGEIEYFPIGNVQSSQNYIFSTEEEFQNWISKNLSKLTSGSLLFINDANPDTPNYYYDGGKLISLNPDNCGYKILSDLEFNTLLDKIF